MSAKKRSNNSSNKSGNGNANSNNGTSNTSGASSHDVRNWRIDEEFAENWSANDMADTLLSFGMNALMDYVLAPEHRTDKFSLSATQKANVCVARLDTHLSIAFIRIDMNLCMMVHNRCSY